MRARKVDGNQSEIIAALTKCGALVTDLSGVGRGVPDLLVAVGGKLYLLEAKAAKGKLTDAQKDWHARWSGYATVVRTPEQALAAVGLLK